MTKKKSKKFVTKKVAKKKSKTKKAKQTQVILSSPVDNSIKVVVATELADDAMIEREMMGEVLPFFIYRFKQDGKDVVGLTVKGVSEVVRRLSRDPKSGTKIRINPQYLVKEEVVRDGEKGIEISVYAEDLVTGNSAWGLKFEPYHKTGRNGLYKNTFAVEKALSKAERNAKRKLIPEVLATKMIQKLMQDPSNVQQIEPPQNQMIAATPRPPQPSTTEEVKSVIIKAIETGKDIAAIIDLAQKTTDSPKFDSDFKSKVNSLANRRVDYLSNGK